MAQVSQKLEALKAAKNWTAEEVARELGVSRASLYNYIAKKDLPRMEILRRAHKMWGWTFKYANYDLDENFFESVRKDTGPPKEKQIPLPFIEALRNEDIEILKVTARRPNAVEVTFKIRFAG